MSGKGEVVVVVVVAVLATVMWTGRGFDTSYYPHSSRLGAGYTVYWRAEEADTVEIAVDAETSGWVGFGIAEQSSGSMPGADVMVGWVSEVDGTVSVRDMYTTGFTTPVEDDGGCSDWVVVSGEQSNGHTLIELVRSVRGSDGQDRAIPLGDVHVIWAMGESDPIGYHASRRGTSQLPLRAKAGAVGPAPSSPPPPPPPPLATLDLLHSEFAIPTVVTHYEQSFFALPTDAPYHLVEIEPVIDAAAHVHHLVLYFCTQPSLAFCWDVVAAWAVGGGSIATPSEAGFRFGAGSGFTHMRIEFHYDNPQLIAGVTDSSGVRLHYTAQLRDNDAGVLWIGDPLVLLPDLPGSTADLHLETSCPSECTARWASPLNVFANFLHLHEVGTRIWMTVHRNGSRVEVPGSRIEFWDFNHQLMIPAEYTLFPGDEINLHGMFDTTSRTGSVKFGSASNDEMLMAFLMYWPAQSGQWNCGYMDVPADPTNRDWTVCQSDVLDIRQPKVPDPPGGEIVTYGTPASACAPLAAIPASRPGPTSSSTSGPTPGPSPVHAPSSPARDSAAIFVAAGVGAALVLVAAGIGIASLVRSRAKLRRWDTDTLSADKELVEL